MSKEFSRTRKITHLAHPKVSAKAIKTDLSGLTIIAARGTFWTNLSEILVMARHRHASEGLIVENSEVCRVARSALALIVAVVAIVRTHCTSKSFTILFEPRLANVLAGTQDG